MHSAGSFHQSPYSSRGEHKKLDDVEDDKKSTMSRASGVPRAEHALDTLRLVAGNRVRHARCAPEFLEEVATKGVHYTLKRPSSKNCKVISGSEARSAFKDYIDQHNPERLRHDNDKLTNHDMPSPIVFAVTVWEADNKCVDYYMTWRGNPEAREDRDFERKFSLFDAEFRRLAKSLDKEYQKISSLRTYRNLSQSHRGYENKPPSSQSIRRSRPPPGILVSTPDESLTKPGDQTLPKLPEPPVSAADSVMSLPLLNMIRGVPFGNRVPLRVTNPDRLSIISETTIVPERTVDAPSPNTTTNLEPDTSQTLTVPSVFHSSKHAANDDGLKKSSSSTGTRSSRSSRSNSPSENLDSSRNPSPTNQGKSRHSPRHEDKSSSTSGELPQFLIILLGDKFETDENSWHGLERQSSVRSLPAERHSPWIEGINHKYSPGHTPNDSDSGESDGEERNHKHPPVIPMKPLIEAMMGFGSHSPYYQSPPVIPGGLQYQVSIANASPAANHSPYLYSSPRLDSSPYLPPWLPQLQIPPHAPSRPSSRAYSSASYSSPYMQSHTGPF